MRSIHFALIIASLILVVIAVEPMSWRVYAIITTIAAYSTDIGGRPLPRLIWTALGGFSVFAGAAIGAAIASTHSLIVWAFVATGIIYALVENVHPAGLSASRAFFLGLCIGSRYSPFDPINAAIIVGSVLSAWTISITWDAFRRSWRPSRAPVWSSVVSDLNSRKLDRFVFILAIAIVIPLAYRGSAALSLQDPDWVIFMLILVLRFDFTSSPRLMIERFLGTIFGVLFAGLYMFTFPSQAASVIGIVFSALIRWPAQDRHGILGVAALLALVSFMTNLVAPSFGNESFILEARVIDTAVGCGFAILALAIYHGLIWLAVRVRGRLNIR